MADTWIYLSHARVGGHPVVDFVNTTRGWKPQAFGEHLDTYARLLDWCQLVKVLPEADIRRLRSRAESHPRQAKALLAAARDLRLCLHETMMVLAGLNTITEPSKALDLWAHRAAANTVHRARIGRWDALWAQSDRLDLPLLSIASRAVDLLARPDSPSRLKSCPLPHGCGWMFLDQTRNQSKVYCTTEICGNRAKQYRYRRRQARRA